MSIFDALKKSVLEGFSTSLSTADMIFGLLSALAAGLFILFIYRRTMRRVAFNRSYCISLLLICSISSMIVLTISSNLALSLGMVGALSIVRFRTAVKDATDTAFLFWGVAAGITSGAGFYVLTLIGCLFIGLVSIISVIVCDKSERPYLLVVRAENAAAAAGVEKALELSGTNFRLSSLVESQRITELIYELGISNKNRMLASSLREIPGVTSVSLVDCNKE